MPDSAIPEIVATTIPVAVGGVLVWLGTVLQHRLTTKREDRLREAEARTSRVQFERDLLAALIAAMHDWGRGVLNLKLAYVEARQGSLVDTERIRMYQDGVQAFAATLARARLSVQNPAARPLLNTLREQHVVMTNLLNLEALGSPTPEFVDRFEEFQRLLGGINQGLEEAALRWDGR